MSDRRLDLDRVIALLAALVCLLFVGLLRDVSDHASRLSQAQAPELPASVSDRDAALALRVLDSQGEPARGVRVRVFSIIGGVGYRAGSGESDGEGRVSIEGLPRGETWILAEGKGLARTSTRLVLEPGERSLELRLSAAETFEVVVVDPLQRPIRGVTVTLFTNDPLPYRGLTDARGLARFEGLGPPPYAVEVTATGFDSKLFPKLGLEDSPLFVKLERLGGLEVTVLEPGGTPAKDATVLVAGSALWPARSATTDIRGRVTISGLGRGFYDLRAERPPYVSDTESGVLLERGEIKQVTLSLVSGGSVTVTVTDGDGDDAPPVPNADVALVEGGVSSFPRYGRTDKKGKVTLGPLAGSDATVSAQAEGFVARSAVAVEEGQTEVRVSLLRGGKIIGRVVDEKDFPIDGAQLEVVGVGIDGMPIVESTTLAGFREDHFAFALPGATPLVPAGELGVMPIIPDIPRDFGPLTVTRSRRGGDPWVSGGRGQFTLTPVTPGRVRVVARHPRYVEALSAAVDLAPGGEVEVVVVMRQGGILEGRVLETDRTPVAGARVEVSAVVGTSQRVTYTAEDGSFAFAALPLQVLVSVARPEATHHPVVRMTMEVPAEDRREVEIILPKPREPVTFRIVDERGYPLSRADIEVSSLDWDAPLRQTLFSDDAGETELADSRGLPLRVVVERRGRAPTVTEIERAPALVELALEPALTATGTVETRHGFVADAELTLQTPSGERAARTDEQGVFHFVDLAAGQARLLIVKEGLVPHEQDVGIAGDPEREVELGRFEMTEGGSVKGVVVDERGDPIFGARVANGRVPTYLPIGPLPLGITSSDREGRFLLVDLPPGPTTVEAYRIGFGRAMADVEVRAREVSQEVRIEMVQDPEADVTDIGGQASLAVTLDEALVGRSRVVTFVHVPLGGEARRAGILAGDRLLAYNGVPIRSLGHARRLLTGPIDEDFILELSRPPDMRWSVRVRREKLRR